MKNYNLIAEADVDTDPLFDEAFKLGIKAGREDTWIVENEKSLGEDLEEQFESVPVTDPKDLIMEWEEAWEGTLHWRIVYGDYLWDIVSSKGFKNKEEQIDIFQDLVLAFWEGFYKGLSERGIDIYDLAKGVVAG